MEVKAGYRRSELGVIPADWEVRSVREVGQITTGPFGTLLKASEYSGQDGVPLVSVGEIRDGHFRTTERTPRVPATVVRRLPQYVLRAGDIVFGRKGAVGRSALVSSREDGWFLGSDGISVRPFRVGHPPYLAVQLQSAPVKSWLAQNAIGTTMASLNQQILSRVLVPLATAAEQRAIAAALSDVDAVLDGLDRLIAKKRDLKQGAMQQLLTGQTRLPGFGEAWRTTRLGALGATYGGLTGKSKSDFGIGDGRYVTFMNVMSNVVIDCSQFERVRIQPADVQNRVRENDLLFNGSSETPEEVAMCAFMANDVPGLYLNSFCFGFRFHNPDCVDGLFMAYYIRSREGREVMKSLAQGSTRYNLSKCALLDASLRLPPVSEQRAIASVLSDMDAEISALEAGRDKTRALKQGMMQELLTGRTRLV